MAYQNTQTLVVDQVLQKKAVGLYNDVDKYINKQCAPMLEHNHSEGEFVVQDAEWGLRLEDQDKMLISSGDEKPLAIDARLGSISFKAKAYQLAAEVGKREIDLFRNKIMRKMPAIDPSVLATDNLVHKMESLIEKDFIDTIVTAANYATNYSVTLAASARWDVDTVDPDKAIVTYLDAIEEGVARSANKFIVSKKAWRRIRMNPFLRQKLQTGDAAVSTDAFIDHYFNGQGSISFSEALYWQGNEGASSPTGTTRMLENDAIFAYVDPTALDRSSTGGTSFATKTFAHKVVDLNYRRLVYRKPFQWNTEGHYVILRDSWGFMFPGVDSAASNKINSAYLVKSIIG